MFLTDTFISYLLCYRETPFCLQFRLIWVEYTSFDVKVYPSILNRILRKIFPKCNEDFAFHYFDDIYTLFLSLSDDIQSEMKKFCYVEFK